MEIDQAIKGYIQHRQILQQNFNSPNKISDELMKIATYLTYVGDALGELKEQYEVERAIKYKEYLDKDYSNAQAENLARADTAKTRGQKEKVEIMLKNGQQLISIGQSRLRVLGDEARNQT